MPLSVDNTANLANATPVVYGSPSDVATPAANTPAVVTLPGASGFVPVLFHVDWGYSGSGTLAGGSLSVMDGSVVVRGPIPITGMGAGFTDYNPPLAARPGNSLTITLAAGGANVSGSLSVHRTMAASQAALQMIGSAFQPSLNFSDSRNSQYL
jgi:hypothetical protein